MSASNPITQKNFWDNYWFYPAPLFNLAICRIIVVGFQLGYLFVRHYWNEVLTRASIPAVDFSPLPIFKLLNSLFPWDLPPTVFLMAVFIATVVSGIFSLVGLRTRLSLLVFALGNLYIQTYLYSFGRIHHSQTILLIALFIFTLAPVGSALSVDDLSRRLTRNVRQKSFQAFSVLQSSSAFARWPLLLIQWIFGLVYLSAAINKLSVDGDGLFSTAWMNGYTLQYYLISDGSQWGSDLGVWLGQFHVPAIISSWFAVLFEATFFLTLIFPRLIWVYIPLGAALHTGIWMAQRAPFFQYVALYAVFIPWAAVIKMLSNRLGWQDEQRKAELFYNGRSDRCIRILTILSYFDWFGRIRYHDLARDRSAQVQAQPEIILQKPLADLYFVGPKSTVEGFFALRKIISYLPPLWPLLAVMYIPGISAIGEKVYTLATFKEGAIAKQ